MRRGWIGVLLMVCAARAEVTLVHGARIAGAPGADAIVISGEHIVCVGRSAELAPALSGAKQFDARGGLVLPGLMDPHVHLRDLGLAPRRVKLYEIQTMAGALAEIDRYAKAHPAAAWILGGGWSYQLAPGSSPTRHQLDSVVPDRPVYLESYDGHAIWANTKALALAGVTAGTPDPDGGHIVREADGAPAGTLIEEAGALVGKAVPDLPKAEALEALREGGRICAANGLTAIDDILTDEDEGDLLAELARAGQLPIRVRACPPLSDDLAPAIALRARLAGSRVEIGFLKGFVDGVLESRTAYMVDPYPGGLARGAPLMTPDALARRVRAAHRAGFQVALHATGDGGVRMALDAFAHTRAWPRRGPPHRIEHCEVVHPGDLPRFRALDVCASMQPMHAVPTGGETDQGVWARNVGHARMNWTFPWRDLLAAQAPLAFGSDAPVVPAEPLPGLAVALTRQSAVGHPPGGWNGAQRLDWGQALSAYTRGAARAMGLERRVGRIEAGMEADLVILEPGADPADPRTLWKAKVAKLFVRGR